MTMIEWTTKLLHASLLLGVLVMLPYIAALAWAFDPEPNTTFSAELLEFWEAWRGDWSSLI